MQLSLTDEQRMIVDAAHDFLRQYSDSVHIRKAWDNPQGYLPSVSADWAAMGWNGILIPESFGGMGLSLIEAMLLHEQLGRFLWHTPHTTTQSLALPFLLHCAPTDIQHNYLPQIATGDLTATAVLGYCSDTLSWSANPTITAHKQGEAWILNGSHPFVMDATNSKLWIVLASEAYSNRILAFLIPHDILTDGCLVETLNTFDQGCRASSIQFNNLSLPTAITPIVMHSLDERMRLDAIGALLIAAEQVGGSQACLDMTTSYVQERQQFGRPVGSFQAVKHRLAHMSIGIEAARSSVYGATCVMADDTLSFIDRVCEAGAAKILASEHYQWSASEAIQLHGGVGFTWEYDPHLHFKRARTGQILLGHPSYWLEQLSSIILNSDVHL